MNTFLMFMDESFDDPQTINKIQKENFKDSLISGTLTGILLPINIISLLQQDLYQSIISTIYPENKNVLDIGKIKSIEKLLHGSEFMSEWSDKVKYKVLSDIVNIISTHKVQIVRVCNIISENNKYFYYSNQNIISHNKIIGKCFSDLVRMLQNILIENIIVPIIEDDTDNNQQKINFSSLIQSSHIILNSSFPTNCSLPNNHNMTEVLYAKKNYSLLTGLVDCISYFLQLKQRHLNSNRKSSFKKNTIEIINKIPHELLHEEICNLQWNNKNIEKTEV